MSPAPTSTQQADLDWARGLADAVIARAAGQDLAVSVCVVDRRGEPMQHDAMDDAPTSGAYVAEAVAAAAALFHAPSGDLAERIPTAEHLLPVRVSALSGGLPVRVDGRVVAGLGVGDRTVPVRRARRRRPGRARMTVRVCVVGTGAIGSLYAAHLARLDDVEVWAVDPYAAHVDAINAHGLRVVSRLGPCGPPTSTTEGSLETTFTAQVHATTDPADVPPCDFGIVATKAEHTRAAVAACADVFADAAVASVQNGLGNEEVVAELVPRVIRGTILPAGAVTEPGVVRFDAPGDTWLGPFEPKPATMGEVVALSDLLTRAGLPCHAMVDARGPQWDKVIFNSATSPLAALTGLSVGPVCEDPALRAEVDALMAEALEVCEVLGIETAKDAAALVEEAIEVAYHHKPSMLQDVLARRRTEIDVLNGGIAAQGRAVGVPTPRHDAMVALVHGLERSWDEETT